MIPFLIICSADRLENYLKYKFCLLSCGSLSDAKIGVTWEGFSSCRAWEETNANTVDRAGLDKLSQNKTENSQKQLVQINA